MSGSPAVVVDGLTHSYGERVALDNVSFEVATGSCFGLLGPNGGGKTTLFRLLTTLLPVKQGRIEVFGHDVSQQSAEVRRLTGVTFQSPSLDGKLTVGENLKHQGWLYGLSGKHLTNRIDWALDQLGLTDRRKDKADQLSGGLKRRVEIAKGLLHSPRLLCLDEPSTGLDPAARHDLWDALQRLQTEEGVTILVTTHLMDEADRCDQLLILDLGKVVAAGTPEALRQSVGGSCIRVETDRPAELAESINDRFAIRPQQVGRHLRIEHESGHEILNRLLDAFPEQIRSISLAKPTLEDVFIQRTGKRFEAAV